MPDDPQSSDSQSTPPPARGWRKLYGGLSGNVQGMGLMTLSTMCQACMYVAIRTVPGEMHPFEIAFFRNFFAVILLLAWHRHHFIGRYRTKHVRLHLLRGVLNVTAMLMFFYAVIVTPLADVAALGFTAPLFATVLAVFVLRERVPWQRAAIIAIGFCGALVILRPGLVSLHLGPVLLLVSAAIWAVTMMVIKVLARTDSSTTITIYMGTVMAPLSLIAALFHWQWPDGWQLLWFAGIALLGTIGQMSLTQSFRVAEVSAVLPLDFLKLVWNSAFGFALFAEVPDAFTWVGAVMIFGSTTWLTLRESRRTPRTAGNSTAGNSTAGASTTGTSTTSRPIVAR